ncbi:C2 family cysteine protease [Bradyrhizobium canariense]|uniref:C2 family cysteine protease n=1 Tax=Bradyrhizobium canariense TaxID=255045 RepID=UPI001302B4A2|nr:C2 family cysteine protease [Bradyrhizobium canariense]
MLDIYGFCQRWIKVGQIEIPPPTPSRLPPIAPFQGAAGVAFRVAPIRGRAFAGRPCAGDVIQGELSNCHLAAAVAAVAHFRPEALTLKACGRFYEATVFSAGRGRRILVDRELYHRPSGELIFGQNGLRQSTRPAWWPILEKAYATALGGYDVLDRGGSAYWALQMITGLPARHRFLALDYEQEHWRDLTRALATSSPTVATTPARAHRNSGIAEDHCYTVLSCREHRSRRWITLRNPWGEMTPPGVRRWRDGVFEMQWLSFVRHFSGLSFLEATVGKP